MGETREPMATNRLLILAEPHGINLRNTCEGHMGTMGIRYGTFGKEYEVKQRTN